MKNYIFIVAMGLLVPVGIISAGFADESSTKWLGYALSAVGVIGVFGGLYRQNEEYKLKHRDDDKG